ncbi:hypothetical protein ONE63_002430 [Megalurothrips usitatus]|uniref:Centrosomal protein of 131 kDa n=1 Tax=Megalurothrips usitatus TaxID=439358 RepID=A0AAV7XE87_9NEOP|nr:hypothetical protein ONE63_002430 [Megalurothrips usitatus]
MSQSDRDFSKCRKSDMKEGDGSDLSLSGSQVSLVSRPRSVMGKASSRALSVSGPRIRRPLSAVPAVSFTDVPRDKRRPYSADGQLLPSSYQKRNKLSTCFSMSADAMGFAQQDIETDGDIEFSSSTLVSSQLSDQLGGAWMELEMRGFYLRHSHPSHHPSSSTDNGSDLLCSSEVSEDQTRSEKSLGERIQAMARNHVNHDPDLCVHTNPPHDRSGKEFKNKLENACKEEDPKRMSTEELHNRMVESGLLSSSIYSLAPMYRKSDPKNENSTSYGALIPATPTQSKEADAQKKSENEFCGSSTVSEVEPAASEFWNQHRAFYQSISKSTCGIDQISFPKEHDVDSMEGDSSYSNNGLESHRKKKQPSHSTTVHRKCEDDNLIQWPIDDLAPVRFQQWVTDNGKGGSPNSNESSATSSFYCGTRVSQPHTDKSALNKDCTVEEVSTDSEYSKPQPLSYEAEKGPSNPGSNSNQAQCLSETVVSSRVKNDGGLPVTNDCFVKNSDTNLTDLCVAEPNKFDSNYSYDHGGSEALVDEVSIGRPCLRQEGKCTKRNLLAFKENLPDKKACNTPKSGGRKSLNSLSSDVKKEQQLHQGARRRTDTMGHGSNRKCGKNPVNSSRSFCPPKEESLPGEMQTELLSWMAMCSDNLLDHKDAVDDHSSNEPLLSTSASQDKDSPYNEIMTILRVLEEKEDEGSLLRILNKNTDLRIGEDTTCQEVGSSVPPANTLVVETTDLEILRSSSSHTLKTGDVTDKSGSEAIPLEQNEVKPMCSATSKPTCPPCANGGSASTSQSSAQGELRDLLTFLDAVDQSCSAVLQPRSPPSPRPSPRVIGGSGDSHGLEELLVMGRSDLAQEIISLRLALEDRDATIKLLKVALREQKDSQARQNAAHTAELDNRIRQVKAECEAVIKRHQKFIDQRCESLIQDAKESEEKHTKACRMIEEKHKVEMQRVKDITAATEKLKRERWVENKTQKIKELTVRGLEPELSRLTSQHEQEMSALRTLHAQELEQMEARAARRASQQMEALREQLVQEKEDALTREREMLRQRIEKQQLLYEEEGAEQRRRLVAEVRREQDRLATLEARLEAQLEERKRGLEREAEQERDRMRRDYADKLNEMHRKQQNETLQYREELKAEKESWVEAYQQQQKQILTQTTNEIREQLRRERDREIEVVIERLESEATISREEREKALENRLRRVREQLTSELRDVESALNSLKEKHAELRSQLQEKDDKLVGSEALNHSLRTQLFETRKIADQLSAERADLKQTLQCELSNEMDCLRQQMAQQHARHQQQLQVLSEQSERERQTHQQELQQLFDRVKLAIAKKEEVVKVAKAKQKAAEEQNSHLQALLEHRRKESLLS